MARIHFIPAFVLAAAVMLATGCGDDSAGPEPVTGVEVSADEVSVEIGFSTGLAATVSGGTSKAIDWYVNGCLDGNPIYGTISHTSTATYNAPDSLPDDCLITIGARSAEDSTKSDTCMIQLTFRTIHVDADAGSDDTGNGCINLPMKSITRGLLLADSGMIVLVAPGIYDDTNGETFPLIVSDGRSLVGENWEGCVIRGHTSELTSTYGIRLVGSNCSFRKFTVEDVAALEDRWNHAVYVSYYNEDVHIDSIRSPLPSGYVFLRLERTTDVTVENCYFDITNDEHGRAFEVVFNNYGTVIRNCYISGYWWGLCFNAGTDALVEGCTFEGNETGIMVGPGVEADQPYPDFGGGDSGSLGGNTIRDNSVCGLENRSASQIYAMYNTWSQVPPVEGVDICNEGDGSIVTEWSPPPEGVCR